MYANTCSRPLAAPLAPRSVGRASVLTPLTLTNTSGQDYCIRTRGVGEAPRGKKEAETTPENSGEGAGWSEEGETRKGSGAEGAGEGARARGRMETYCW